MPKSKSAKKALKISLRNRKFNLYYLGQIKRLHRQLKKLSSKDSKEFQTTLALYYKYVDKAAKKHVLAKNKARRLKSQAIKLAKFKKIAHQKDKKK